MVTKKESGGDKRAPHFLVALVKFPGKTHWLSLGCISVPELLLSPEDRLPWELRWEWGALLPSHVD